MCITVFQIDGFPIDYFSLLLFHLKANLDGGCMGGCGTNKPNVRASAIADF
jgi:hypothetical protein